MEDEDGIDGPWERAMERAMREDERSRGCDLCGGTGTTGVRVESAIEPCPKCRADQRSECCDACWAHDYARCVREDCDCHVPDDALGLAERCAGCACSPDRHEPWCPTGGDHLETAKWRAWAAGYVGDGGKDADVLRQQIDSEWQRLVKRLTSAERALRKVQAATRKHLGEAS